VTLVAVTGTEMEASLLRVSSARVVIGAGDSSTLERKISAELARRPAPLLSFGIAGGLEPQLAAGDCVIPDAVWADGESFVCDPRWVGELRAFVRPAENTAPNDRSEIAGCSPPSAFPTSPREIRLLVGQDHPVASVAAKAARYAASGAQAVDMESHVVARLARRHDLPFAAVRIVFDSAGRDLPPAALVRMRSNGKPHMAAILRSLARRPDQIAALLTLSRDLNVAMRALRAARVLLGDTFAYSAAI
jgi:nucleoside phosphorylase